MLERRMRWKRRNNTEKHNLTFSPPYLLSLNTVTIKRALTILSFSHTHTYMHAPALIHQAIEKTDAVVYFCMHYSAFLTRFKKKEQSQEKCNKIYKIKCHFAFDLWGIGRAYNRENSYKQWHHIYTKKYIYILDIYIRSIQTICVLFRLAMDACVYRIIHKQLNRILVEASKFAWYAIFFSLYLFLSFTYKFQITLKI